MVYKNDVQKQAQGVPQSIFIFLINSQFWFDLHLHPWLRKRIQVPKLGLK